MRLESVTLFRVKLPFKRTFAHASASRSESENLVVRCTTTDGVVGWGEAIARDYVTGETTEATAGRLRECPESTWTRRCWSHPDDVSVVIERAGLGDANVASCALELALLDALARSLGKPLYRVLAEGWPERARIRAEESFRYGGPFGLGSTFDAVATATKLRLFGFRDVKLKVGDDVAVNASRVRIARSILGTGIDLRVDANEAWDLEQAAAFAPTLHRWGVTALEQPFHKRLTSAAVADFWRATRLPIIVDESLCSESDARAAAAVGGAVMFAVKLSKLGGFYKTLGVLAIAEQNDIGVQIGCQVGESGILSAAGRHLAALCPNLRYLEGSHDRFLLAKNLISGDITFGRGGVAPMLKGAGLGVDVDAAAVEQLAEGQWEIYRREAACSPALRGDQSTMRGTSMTHVKTVNRRGPEPSVAGAPTRENIVAGGANPLAALLRQMRSEARESPFVTSVEVAFMRALGVGDPIVRGTDVLAHRFLTLKYRFLLLLGALARWLAERMSPGCYGYHNSRTKHFDAVVTQEVARGAEQVVLLGAGNDSRPYRMPALGAVRVFEVDLPRTQERKRRLVDESFGRLDNVVFVPVDFERDNLIDKLREAGFDPSRKTLFSWEGVSMYLTKQAVTQVLRWVFELSRPGGALIFDYSIRSYTEGRDRQTYGGPQLHDWLRKRGMAFTYGAEAPEIAALLNESGFDVVSDVGPAELETQLKKHGAGTWRVWGNFRVVHARVPALLAAPSMAPDA